MVEKYIDVCVGKTKQKHWETFLLAIFAGMFIAFGASSSSLAVHNIADPGIAKFVAGLIFPVGLMLIVTVTGELFTGDCMLIFGNYDKKYSVGTTIVKLIIVYLGNMVGSILTALLLYGAGQYNMSDGGLGAYTIKVAYGKLNLGFGAGFCSGILCNILVCLAVLMAFKVDNVPGKMMAVFFPIMAFVIGGFEHCVANMYYIPAGILAAGNEKYAAKAAELYGYTAEQLASVNVANFLVKSSIPVTIGNIVGGMIFIALPLYILQKPKKTA